MGQINYIYTHILLKMDSLHHQISLVINDLHVLFIV